MGVGPLCDIGELAAEWTLDVLIPRLAMAIVLLTLSLIRLTMKYPVQLYVGSHPLIRKVCCAIHE